MQIYTSAYIYIDVLIYIHIFRFLVYQALICAAVNFSKALSTPYQANTYIHTWILYVHTHAHLCDTCTHMYTYVPIQGCYAPNAKLFEVFLYPSLLLVTSQLMVVSHCTVWYVCIEVAKCSTVQLCLLTGSELLVYLLY